jgi:hypothetical protein
MRILEGNVNDELKELDGEANGAVISGDAQKAFRDIKAKHEVRLALYDIRCSKTYLWKLELGQLRQKMLEAEQKHAQVVNDVSINVMLTFLY